MDSADNIDVPYAIEPDNLAYAHFLEMMGGASKLEWARVEYDENEVDITIKGVIVGRIVPMEDGFRILFPDGPGYLLDMEDSGEDRDNLTKQIKMTGDSDIGDAMSAIMTAYMWGDMLVSDEEWMDF